MPNWYSGWQRRPTGNGRPLDPMVGEKILGAALELLAERGFRGTTVRCRSRTRRSRDAAAIYRRHENREEMMLAAIDESVGVREVENTGNTELDLVSMLTVVRESVYARSGHPGFGGSAVGVRRAPGATGDIPPPGSLAKAKVDQVGPGARDTPGRGQGRCGPGGGSGYVVGQHVREVRYGIEQSGRHGWVGCENRAEWVEAVRTRAEIRVDFRYGQVT